MINENELIAHAQSGDREAFCELARGYQRRIYSLALHHTRDPQDAEDLSQDVWLKAYRAIADFKGEASFYTWLRQITINTLLNQQRSQFFAWLGGRKKREFIPLDEIEPFFQIEAGLHQNLLVERVMQALGELTPRERLIFLLKHREGMTCDEIAKACGVSAGTIKKALFRTVRKLRKKLGANTPADEFSQLAIGEKS